MTGSGGTAGPFVIVLGREKDHEVALNVWSAALGVLYLAGAPKPGSMAALVHGPIFTLWAAGMVLSGATGLVACYLLRGPERSLEVERAALVIQTGVLLMWAGVALSFNGWSALMAVGLAGAWIWANVRRCLRITRDLRRLANVKPDE